MLLPFSTLNLCATRGKPSYLVPVFGPKKHHCYFQPFIFVHRPSSHFLPLRVKSFVPPATERSQVSCYGKDILDSMFTISYTGTIRVRVQTSSTMVHTSVPSVSMPVYTEFQKKNLGKLKKQKAKYPVQGLYHPVLGSTSPILGILHGTGPVLDGTSHALGVPSGLPWSPYWQAVRPVNTIRTILYQAVLQTLITPTTICMTVQSTNEYITIPRK